MIYWLKRLLPILSGAIPPQLMVVFMLLLRAAIPYGKNTSKLKWSKTSSVELQSAERNLKEGRKGNL